MVATEAMYHKKCLTNLYNQYKSAKNKEGQTEAQILKSIERNALSDVVSYIKETITECHQTNKTPVFTQKSLTDKFNEQLIYYGAAEEFTKKTHCTHLREKIMMEVPGLCEVRDGRQVTLSIEDDVGKALFEAYESSAEVESETIAKAAKVIRKYLLANDEIFDGDVSAERQLSSVPPVLLILVNLILEGGSSNRVVSSNLQRISGNISQLIRFNAVKLTRRSKVKSFRHTKENEPPLPVLIGLMVHAKTRKRKMIERLAEEGLSISYKRVLEIRQLISSQICKEYNINNLVCPSSLITGTFTTAAVDNLDHNPSSATAQSSFHGTTISIFQHPVTTLESVAFKLEDSVDTSEKMRLPESYTEIKPTRNGRPEPPIRSAPLQPALEPVLSVEENASAWLQQLYVVPDDYNDRISFSAFYSQHIMTPSIVTTGHLLPLITEPVTSPATVRHAMTQIKAITEKTNPGQPAVITGDQPVYALGKQIQWMYPKSFEDTIWLLGPLLIEKNFMEAIGNWLEGSGWTKIYEYSTITTAGKADGLLTCAGVSGVKRSRYAHQVTLAALHTLAMEAFHSQSEISVYEEWRDDLKSKSVTAKFWFTVIDMQLLLFMFVRSLRDSNFSLFIACFEKMLPWLAALDHVNYLRWGSVFLNDMKDLPEQIFEEFTRGNFTVKKTNRAFSSIGIDQAHEQNNKVVKVDGGAIGILDDERTLLQWATSGPIISNMIADRSSSDNVLLKHHENTKTFERNFRKHRVLLLHAFSKFGNPFNDTVEGLMNIVSKQIFDQGVADSVINAENLGKKQSRTFREERIQKNTAKPKSLYSTVHKNKLKLFRSKNKVATTKAKLESVTLKERVKLYANLYVGCQSRRGNLDDFFRHENHVFPPALSEYGRIRKPTLKSDFVKCLPAIEEGTESDEDSIDIHTAPNVDAIIVDGPALVQMNTPKVSTTFGEYCQKEICRKILSLAESVQRVDVVFDVYRENSRKRETRELRGKKKDGVRIVVKNDTPIYKRFNQILSVDENKTELNLLIADTTVNIFDSILQTIVVTREENVVSNHSIETQHLKPCYKEEADDRMFIHAKELSRLGYKKLIILTVDSDVIVISLYAFWFLDIEELWIEFGSGKDRRWLPIHRYAKILGEELCIALPFWFAFTGCDTVSQFSGRGKKTAWKTWCSFPEVTETFVRLSSAANLDAKDLEMIERYVVLMYDRSCPAETVNECRKYLFTQLGRMIDNCPPSQDALIQHTKRAMLQSSIWTNCMTRLDPALDITDWGWKVEGNLTSPVWTTLPEASSACQELKKCKCKKHCRPDICTCKEFGLPCTARCKCGGFCFG